MRITYLLTWPYEMGGTERTVITQAEAMAGRHDVEIVGVLSSRQSPFFAIPPSVAHSVLVRTDHAGVPVHADGVEATPARLEELHAATSRLVPSSWESAFSQLTDLVLSAWFRELDTDVLVTTTPALLALASQLAPDRVVVVHQDHRTSELRGSTLAPLLHHGPRVDAVAFLTRPTVEYFCEAWGSAAPRILQVLNPLPPVFRPISRQSRPLVVAAGRFTAEKRFDHLVAAFAPIVEEHPEWSLRLFGEGPRESALRRQITRLQLTDNVEIMGPSATMGAEWATASIAALSSRHEGLSLVVQEAMAAGTPAVSYACPNGPAELITHRVDGLLVENGNIGELTEALSSLIRDPARRAALGAAARMRARAFDATVIADQWDDHFRALVADVRADETRIARVIRRASTGAGRVREPQDEAQVTDDDTSLVTSGQPDPAADAASPRPHPGTAGSVITVTGSQVAVNHGLLPADARRDNLRIAVEAVLAVGAPCFRLPTSAAGSTVVVPERHRRAVAEALGRAASAGALYIAAVSAGGRPGRAEPADDAADVWRSEPERVRVYRRWSNPERTLFYGADLGTDLAFWREEGELLVGPPGGAVTEVPVAWLEDRVTDVSDGVPVPELEALAGLTLMDDVTFPVDAVYTWVDGSDPRWLAARRQRRASSSQQLHLEADSEARYRSRDELRYSLRSLEYYAPWVRTTYVVTAGQVPAWLAEEHPGLVVVDHKDVFRRTEDLPTFNSHAIEAQLHHVDGLSEQFIYFNDDVFLGRSLAPSAFFTAAGMPKVFLSPTTVGFPEGTAPPHMRAALNNRGLIRRDFGRTLTNTLLHTPHPLRRSLLAAMEERYAPEFARTTSHPFRDDGDISVTSSFFQHFALATGQAVRGALRVSYVGLGGPDVGRRLARLLNDRAFDVFSIGDFHESDIPPDEIDDMVRSFLQAYWPFPGPHEV